VKGSPAFALKGFGAARGYLLGLFSMVGIADLCLDITVGYNARAHIYFINESSVVPK
jgi:hypothetical protein